MANINPDRYFPVSYDLLIGIEGIRILAEHGPKGLVGVLSLIQHAHCFEGQLRYHSTLGVDALARSSRLSRKKAKALSEWLIAEEWLIGVGNNTYVLGGPLRYPLKESRDWRYTRKSILERDNYTCHYCGAKAESVDHITPRSQGGLDTEDNLAACCKSCNSSKGAQTPDEWLP